MDPHCEVCGEERATTVLQMPLSDGRQCTWRQCDRCGLVRLQTPDLFDYSDPAYLERLTRQALSGDRLWAWTLDRVHERRRPPGLLIEVGAGVGTQLAAARDRGWQVLGYDINPDCTQAAAILHHVEVRCENFLDLPAAHTADVILMNQLIEHVPDPRPFLDASRRLLKPGGLLVMSTPNWNFAQPLLWLHQRAGLPLPSMDHIKPTQHIRLYSPRTMQALASAQGWRMTGLLENPTDLLGNRGPLSPRRLLGALTRKLSAASHQRLHVGMNMTVFFET
jgi:2-polyprenyl-3-methyl-5-hydroxy-6-metoxy-1,4-benzoquinol methylase